LLLLLLFLKLFYSKNINALWSPRRVVSCNHAGGTKDRLLQDTLLKILSLLEIFVSVNVMCCTDENKLWMMTRIAGGEWFPFNTRYFMRLGVLVVRDFVDP
jgi:hypothetical protein